MKKLKNEAPMDWDTSDTPQEPTQARSGSRPPPIPVKVKDAHGRPPKFLPGANQAPFRRNEAATAKKFWNVTHPGSGQVVRNVPGDTPYAAKAAALSMEPSFKQYKMWDLGADPSDASARIGAAILPGSPAKQPVNPMAKTQVAPTIQARPQAGSPSQPARGRFRRAWKNNETVPTDTTESGMGRRQRSDTQQMVNPDARMTGKAGPKPLPGEKFFDVSVPGIGVYRVPADDDQQAIDRVATFVRDGGDADVGQVHLDPRMLKAAPSPTHTYETALREAIRKMVREVVRKKAGGGGYVLYGPNKGKKKNPKPAGEFPTRLAAKRAELARFPPKDPEQLKKLRKRLDKLAKDPKKRAEAERKDLSGRKPPKKTGKPAHERKKKTEALTHALTRSLQERLFSEDELPGSPWDERIGSLQPDAIASDKKLHALHKGLEKASLWALGDAHRGLAKVLKGMAKVNPGDAAFDPERRKTFMPVMLDVDGVEIGPVHLYIDGGHVKIEISGDARTQISELEPDFARDLRGGLMSFQEDHLPEIDYAKKAWGDRDAYLDKLHARLEKHASGLSGVEHHLMKQLLGKTGKRK